MNVRLIRMLDAADDDDDDGKRDGVIIYDIQKLRSTVGWKASQFELVNFHPLCFLSKTLALSEAYNLALSIIRYGVLTGTALD